MRPKKMKENWISTSLKSLHLHSHIHPTKFGLLYFKYSTDFSIESKNEKKCTFEKRDENQLSQTKGLFQHKNFI